MMEVRDLSRMKRGSKQHSSVLDDHKVLWMREMYRQGRVNMYGLAAIFKISVASIHNVIRCKTWKHVHMAPSAEVSMPNKSQADQMRDALRRVADDVWTTGNRLAHTQADMDLIDDAAAIRRVAGLPDEHLLKLRGMIRDDRG